MDSKDIEISIALDNEQESGIDLLLRFVEILRLNKYKYRITDLLEKSILDLEISIRDGEDELGQQAFLIIKTNLILYNLGKSLLDTDLVVLKKLIDVKKLINYLFALDKVFKKSKGLTLSDLVDRNLEIFKLEFKDPEEEKRQKIELHIPEIEKKDIEVYENHVKKIQDQISINSANTAFSAIKVELQRSLYFGHFVKVLQNKYLSGYNLLELKNRDYLRLEVWTSSDKKETIDINLPFKDNPKDIELQWNLKIHANEKSLAKVGFLLWTLGSSLEGVKGVSTEIEEIKIGSIWAKVKIFFADIIAKEETKAVLEGAQKIILKAGNAGISHYLERPTVEVDKIKLENIKLDKEAELLDHKIQEFDLKDSKILAKLEIDSKALDNRTKQADIERKEIENQLKKLEYIERLSELVVKGILSVDDLRIDIDECLFLLKKGTTIVPGNSIGTPDETDTPGNLATEGE